MMNDYPQSPRYESQAFAAAQKAYDDQEPWAGALPGQYTAYSNPSFLAGVNGVVNPFGNNSPYWDDPYRSTRQNVDSAVYKPFDAAAWTAQRILFPGAATWAANKFMGRSSSVHSKHFVRSIYAGAGLHKTLTSRTMAGMAMRGSASLAGFAGGMALPLAVGMAATEVMDLGVQGYSRVRAGTNDLRDNFRGVTFGDTGGGLVSGGGLSRTEAARMATSIDRAGTRDMNLSSSQYQDIASRSSAYGFLDDTGANKIADKVKGIAQQVKLISMISNNPDMKFIFETLEKLKHSGASISGGANSQAMQLYSSLSTSARIAGVTTDRLLNQVASYGGSAFQSVGMNGYAGMGLVSNLYAGFASSYRTGGINSAAMARLGGIDNATRSAFGAASQAASDPYMSMIAMRRYRYGMADTGSIHGDVTGLAGVYARDTVSALGSESLYGAQSRSRLLEEGGSEVLERSLIEKLKAGGVAPKGKGGKYSHEQLAGVMTSSGYSPTEIQSFISLQAGMATTGARNQALKAIEVELGTRNRQILDEGLIGDNLFHKTLRGAKKLGIGFKEGVQDLGYGVAGVAASAADRVGMVKDRLNYGGLVKSSSGPTMLDTDKMKGLSKDASLLVSSLHESLEQSGEEGELADQLLKSDLSSSDSKKMLRKYLKLLRSSAKGKLRRDRADSLLSAVDERGLYGELKDKGGPSTFVYNESLDTSTTDLLESGAGGRSPYESLRRIGGAMKVLGEFSQDDDPENLDRLLKSRSEFEGIRGTHSEKVEALKRLTRVGLKTGYYVSGIAAAGLPSADDLISGSANVRNVTSDPLMQAELSQAISQKNRVKVESLLMQVVASNTGGRLKTKEMFNIAESATVEELAQLIPGANAAAKQAQNVSSAGSNADYSSHTSIMKGIELSSNTMLQAANRMWDAANKLSGSNLPVPTTESNSGAWNTLKNWPTNIKNWVYSG